MASKDGRSKLNVPPSFEAPDLDAAVVTAEDAAGVLSLASSAARAHAARATETPTIKKNFMVVVRIWLLKKKTKTLNYNIGKTIEG